MNSVTVIFPCYQEPQKVVQNSIEALTQRAKKAGWKIKFIIAQNGDTHRFNFKDKNISIIFEPQKSYGKLLKKALLMLDTDWFYISNADLPFGPGEFATFISIAEKPNSPDCMVGSKLNPRSDYQIHPLRRLVTIMCSAIIHALFPYFPVRDPNGSHFSRVDGFKELYPKLSRLSFSFNFELVWLYHVAGARFHENPVVYHKKGTTSVKIIKDSWQYFWDLIIIRITYIPMTIKSYNPRHIAIFFLVVLGFFYYISPLLNTDQNLAMGVADSLAAPSYVSWFCDNFVSQNFHNPFMYAPFGVNLQSGYDMPIQYTLVCPLRPLGPIVMFNVLIIIQLIFIITTALLVSQKFISNPKLRVTYILLSSFSSFFIVRSQIHHNLLSLIWGTQLMVLVWWQLNLKSLRSILITSLSSAIVLLSGWQNIPLLTPLIMVLGIRALLSYFKLYKLNLSFLKNVAIGLVGFGILFIPFAYPIATAPQNTDIEIYLKQSLYVYSADAASYLLPAQSHRLLGEPLLSLYKKVTAPRGISYKEFTVSPDIVVLLIFFPVTYYLLKHRTRIIKPLLIIIALQILLSFGPQLTILGTKVMDLPYFQTIWEYYPFKANRTPARYGAPALILITLVTLIGIDRYLKSISPKSAQQLSSILLLYAFITSFFLYPNTTFSFLNYPPQLPFKGLEIIKNDPKLSYVLNIPLAVMEDPSQNFLQSFHQKALIAGYASYLAVDTQTLKFIETSPTLSKLSCANQRIQNPIFPGEIFKPAYFPYLDNPHLFVKELQQKNIDYIIFHTDLISNYWCQELAGIKERLDANPHIKIIDTSPVFTVYQIEPIQSLIDENASTVEPYTYFYFGPGWHPPYEDPKVRNLISDVGDIFIEVDTDKTVTVTIGFDPPLNRKVEMYQEGKLNGVHDVESTLEFEYPATKGKNTLGLKYYPCDQQNLSNPGCVPFWVSSINIE
jgi:hypothetical protein